MTYAAGKGTDVISPDEGDQAVPDRLIRLDGAGERRAQQALAS
jgi:hypothetical protein